MEEFYRNLRSVGVSAVTGQGCADFEAALEDACKEFHSSYVEFLVEQRRDIEEKRQQKIQEQLQDFERGLAKSSKAGKRGRDAIIEEDGADDGEPLSAIEADVRNFSIQER